MAGDGIRARDTAVAGVAGLDYFLNPLGKGYDQGFQFWKAGCYTKDHRE